MEEDDELIFYVKQYRDVGLDLIKISMLAFDCNHNILLPLTSLTNHTLTLISISSVSSLSSVLHKNCPPCPRMSRGLSVIFHAEAAFIMSCTNHCISSYYSIKYSSQQWPIVTPSSGSAKVTRPSLPMLLPLRIFRIICSHH